MDPAVWKRVKNAYAEAIELPTDARSSFLVSIDDQIRENVARLLAADSDAANFIDRPFLLEQGSVLPPEESAVGTVIDDYRILAVLGSGGMGTVYLAEHEGEGFTHRVALKLIKRGMDTDMVLRRFLTERQILASLDHPNIARMLDGGSTPAGVPYFVMEHVEGLPIRSYCDTNDLDVAERIELFAKVCAAVSYAHQKLVVHRDLKPSNVLVTPTGEPKLLDFGIAKLLQPNWNESTEPLTATQFRILTPEYSSPEQLRGEATTTSTDVYSLGVMLYELLTGVRPHQRKRKDPQMLVEAIESAEPVKPSDAVLAEERHKTSAADITDNALVAQTGERTADTTRRPTTNSRQLKGDIDNIVLKAIKPEADRRYASVQELLDDLRNYLAGRPVKATADSSSYRLKKFFRRHRTAVAASAAAALLLIGITGFTGWQYLRAERERARAQRQFEETRSLSKSVLYELHDAIEPLEGSTQARALLVSKALEYLDRLASENSSDAGLQTELADAYQRIGDIQGGLWRSNLGQREQAEESYAKAFQIRKSLVDAGNTDPKLRWKLAQAYAKNADSSYSAADPAGMLENSQKSLDLLIPIEADLGSDSDFMIDLAAGYAKVARGFAMTGKFEPAIENINQAIKVLETAVAREPATVSLVDALSTVYDYSAEIHSGNGRKDEALALYRRGLEQQKLAAELAPNNPVYRRNLAASYVLVSQLRCQIGDCKAALPDVDKGIELLRALVKSDPQNADFKYVAGAALQNKGVLLAGAGRYDEAIEILTSELKTSEAAAAADPGDKIAPFTTAKIKHELGRAYLGSASQSRDRSAKAERLRAASRLFESALVVFKEYRDNGITVGEDAALADVVAEESAKCSAELARLGVSSKA
jgi:non-specific serine/threonine protein kinase/serine/threonine-protein kinase